MNYVAIDPSLSCTAMVVNDKKFVYTTPTVAHTKKGEFKRWFTECEDYATIRVFEDTPTNLSHNDLELWKLRQYDRIASTIFEDICWGINSEEPLQVAIEGYSYSSAAGPLIDLVTLSTIIRKFYHINLNLDKEDGLLFSDLRIFQPTEVKQRAAALTYPPIKKGKKIEYRNKDGVAGGSFKKHEMYKVLTENPDLHNDPWVEFIRGHEAEVMEMKSVPKPIEDINDAKILYEILKSPQPLQ